MASPSLLPVFMAMSLIAWVVIARVHVVPLVARWSRRDALLLLVTPHMFRHVGAMAVLPGITAAPIAWTVPLAWGDGITAVLAVLTMVALHRAWHRAFALAWVFNVFGLLDMLHNGFNAATLRVGPDLGVVAYVVALLVPGMLVCHLLVFRTLLRPPDAVG